MLHTATLIVCWSAAAVALQRIDGAPLAAVAALALAAAAAAGASWRFLRVLRRSRWLLVAVALLHLLPALPVSPAPGVALSDAALAGIAQAARLVALLALLAIVLERRSREELVAGIHTLLAPLAWAGVERARFAARLWLTLAYFDEAGPAGARRGVAAALADVERASADAGGVIVLPLRRLGLADQAVVAVIAGLGVGAALL